GYNIANRLFCASRRIKDAPRAAGWRAVSLAYTLNGVAGTPALGISMQNRIAALRAAIQARARFPPQLCSGILKVGFHESFPIVPVPRRRMAGIRIRRGDR